MKQRLLHFIFLINRITNYSKNYSYNPKTDQFPFVCNFCNKFSFHLEKVFSSYCHILLNFLHENREILQFYGGQKFSSHSHNVSQVCWNKISQILFSSLHTQKVMAINETLDRSKISSIYELLDRSKIFSICESLDIRDIRSDHRYSPESHGYPIFVSHSISYLWVTGQIRNIHLWVTGYIKDIHLKVSGQTRDIQYLWDTGKIRYLPESMDISEISICESLHYIRDIQYLWITGQIRDIQYPWATEYQRYWVFMSMDGSDISMSH